MTRKTGTSAAIFRTCLTGAASSTNGEVTKTRVVANAAENGRMKTMKAGELGEPDFIHPRTLATCAGEEERQHQKKRSVKAASLARLSDIFQQIRPTPVCHFEHMRR